MLIQKMQKPIDDLLKVCVSLNEKLDDGSKHFNLQN